MKELDVIEAGLRWPTSRDAAAHVLALFALATVRQRMEEMEAVCGEIRRIMETYREQEATPYGVDTPGGLGNMGDVWSKFHQWDARLAAVGNAQKKERFGEVSESGRVTLKESDLHRLIDRGRQEQGQSAHTSDGQGGCTATCGECRANCLHFEVAQALGLPAEATGEQVIEAAREAAKDRKRLRGIIDQCGEFSTFIERAMKEAK